MKTPSLLHNLGLLALAIIFSTALMFAFVELPMLLDSALSDKVGFPGLDHGRDAISAYKADIYISALNLRWIGYSCLALVIVFIIIGFITKRSGWGLAGAFTLFLPVFGQFAMSMFFLAGLGMLRLGWMPFWDISWNVLDMGDIIYIPFWILMWVFRQFDYWVQPELAWFFMALGAFLFTWGVLVWMQARFGKKGVATSWIYRISRHPQYLGWIIWSYGLILYSPLVNQMKKSWGMASSLPWLLMTMIIIAICMLEELNMHEKYGEQYDEYRKRSPFLFPIPNWLKKVLKFPIWVIIRKSRPENKREIALATSFYTIILIVLSIIWVDFGGKKTFPLLESRRRAEINTLVEQIDGPLQRRDRWYRFSDLAEYGDLAVEPMIAFLHSENPENQEIAAKYIGRMGDTSAIRHLYSLLHHPWENVRIGAIHSLVELKDTNLDKILTEQIERETAWYPRSIIYESLGNINSRNSWDILKMGAVHDEAGPRLAAVQSMAKLYPDSTAKYLIPLLRSEKAYIRIDAVAVAVKICDEKTLPYLIKLLKDENYEIRFFARQAIKGIEAKNK